MSEYNQNRSFNLGVAQDTSVEAALIYDDLAYAQSSFGVGYFYRSDEQMLKRFPMFSKNTIRRHVAKLVAAGWISTMVKKVNGSPILHYQIEKSLLPKMSKTMGIPKMGKTYTNKETIKETKDNFSDSNNSSFGAVANQNSPISAPATALLEKLLEIVNPNEKVTDERIRMLNGRLKNYSEQEIIESATAFSKSVWHKENKRMSIDYLLMPSKFGQWYAQRIPEERAYVPPTDAEKKAEEDRLAALRKDMLDVTQ